MKRLSYFVVTVIAVMLIGVTANAASMKYEDGNLTIKDAPAGAILLHAQYDENGVLERVDISNAENGPAPISVKNGDKLFLWSSIGSITPLCRAIEVGTYDGELTEPSPTPDAVSSATQVEETPAPETTPEATPEVGSKILVAYFSRAGENYSVGVVDKGMAGFGGAIKNMSIGIASSSGKVWIHSGGIRKSGSIMGEQDPFLEAMGDATSGVIEYMDGRIVYINVMNRLSVDCDCDANPAEPDLHDIGILASYDPVALDQACLDLVYAHRDDGAESLIKRIESRNGLHMLEHAEEIGIGSRKYNLVSIDL